MTQYTSVPLDDSNLDITVTEADDLVTIDINPVQVQLGGEFAVLSVNGQSGAVVLDTDDIPEGTTNEYYTDTKVGTYLTNNAYATQNYVDGEVPDNTDQLLEGATNLYYSAAKVDTHLASGNVTDVNISGHSLTWNTDEETLDLAQDGTTLQLGQESHIHVRNNTASAITDGTAVMATGTLGASGRVTVAPMVADGSIEPHFFMGVATETIAAGEDGKVTTFGKVRGIDTSAYNDGDVLWCDPATAGNLTATQPASPNLKIATAFVVNSHQNNGTLFVRANSGIDLHNNHRVEVANLAAGDLLVWDAPLTRWENKTLAAAGVATAAQGANADTALSWGNHATAGYLTSETDPVFTASPANGILAGDITNWNTAHGWGDHSTAGYLTSFTETDPTVPAHVKNILATDITNWNTAHGWGNHATAGYLTSYTETDPTVPAHVKGITTQNILDWDNAHMWGDHAVQGYLTEAVEVVDDGVNAPQMRTTLGNTEFKIVTDTGGAYDATTTFVNWAHLASGSVHVMGFKTTNGHNFFDLAAAGTVDDGSHHMRFKLRGATTELGAYDNSSGPGALTTLSLQASAIDFHGQYSFPTADGTLDQVLTTDGNGNLSWSAVSGGGGGASALGDLTDVTITAVQDGDMLFYNGTAGEWQNTNMGISVTPIVSFSNPNAGQITSFTITNYATYDDPNIWAQVVDSLDNVVVTNAQMTDNYDGTVSFTAPAEDTNYELQVRVQDFGDVASETSTTTFDSVGLFGWTARYIKIADFTTNNDPNDLMYADMRFYTAASQGGTALPANMTSATTPTPYVITSSDTGYSGYETWKAFDSSTGTAFWTLGTSSSVANTWIVIDLGSVQTINSMSVRTSSQASDTSNGFTLYTSDTGAFAGEEVQRETLIHSDAINTTTNFN